MGPVFTIGYQGATVPTVVDAPREAKVELLVDIRAVASSRRPGFAKTALAANVATIGVEYLHLRGLGTPAEGRAAARVSTRKCARFSCRTSRQRPLKRSFRL